MFYKVFHGVFIVVMHLCHVVVGVTVPDGQVMAVFCKLFDSVFSMVVHRAQLICFGPG